MRRLATLLLLLCPAASAYYHFTQFTTRTGPFTPIVQKFDTAALPQQTVQYFIAEQGPAVLAPNDSFASVVSQIRAAAAVWNEVPSSELRLAFGGFLSPGTAMNAPAIEVIFDEIPPGVIARGGPITQGSVTSTANGTFLPIVKSQLVLRHDLSERPSYTERFFLTVVHEFGHTLGLQHSWCSSAMSTEITRATTKARPLAPDDIAGLTALYPSAAYPQTTGTITGRVTLNNAGLNLASVVALSSSGPAVSALTNPDGTYEIKGLTPGSYLVYTHPLPPALDGEPQPVNLVLPTDGERPFTPGAAFDLQFFPQSRTPAISVNVTAAAVTDSINFAVQQRAHVNIHSAQTYSFYGSEAVKPAQLLLGSPLGSIVLFAYGTSTGTAPMPGLSVSVLNAPESVASVQSYASSPVYLQVDVQPHPFSAEGVRHLMFSQNGETYILPSAFRYSVRRAPSIGMVSPNADHTVTITGDNLDAGSQVRFDGALATVKQAEPGRLVVQPPPANPGHRSVIAVLNADGQSSLMTMGASSPSYAHEQTDIPQVSISPAALPAGVETTVEVTGWGTTFQQGVTRLGLGTSDVTVRRVWAATPQRLLANVVVNPGAAAGQSQMTVISGLQSVAQPFGFQVLPAAGTEMYVPISTVPPTIYLAGASVTLPVVNLSASGAATVTLNDQAAQVVETAANHVTFVIPPSLTPGPAVVKISVNGQNVLPIALQIDPPPAVVLAAQTTGGAALSAASAPRPGDTIQLLISGLVEAGYAAETSQVRVTSGTIDHPVQSVQPSQDNPGLYVMQVVISPLAPAGQPLALTLSVDERASQPYVIPLR